MITCQMPTKPSSRYYLSKVQCCLIMPQSTVEIPRHFKASCREDSIVLDIYASGE